MSGCASGNPGGSFTSRSTDLGWKPSGSGSSENTRSDHPPASEWDGRPAGSSPPFAEAPRPSRSRPEAGSRRRSPFFSVTVASFAINHFVIARRSEEQDIRQRNARKLLQGCAAGLHRFCSS